MSSRRLVLASIAIKIAALLLLALAVLYPDLGGLKAKGLGARAVGYSLGLVALPLAWRLLVRRRCVKFSWAADVLCGVPILADLLGNRLDLFDSVSWWDDAMHVVLHGLLTAGMLLQFWPRAGLASLLTAAVAFGGLSGLAWELAEYATFMRHGVELSGAYRDTLGDLCGGMTGSILAGVAVALSRADLLFEERSRGPGGRWSASSSDSAGPCPTSSSRQGRAGEPSARTRSRCRRTRPEGARRKFGAVVTQGRYRRAP